METQEYLTNYIADCCRQNMSEAKQKSSRASSVLLTNIHDIAETLSELMICCRIQQCKAKSFNDVVTDSFLSYDEYQHSIDALPKKRLRKEDLIHDLGRKCLMKRSEALLTYSVIKRAFRAFYNETNDRLNLWMHAAKHMAKLFSSCAYYTTKIDYEPEIRCVYQLLYNRLQTRVDAAYEEMNENCANRVSSTAVQATSLISKFPNSGILGQAKRCAFGNSKDKIRIIYSMQNEKKQRQINEECSTDENDDIAIWCTNNNIVGYNQYSDAVAVAVTKNDTDVDDEIYVNDSEANDSEANDTDANDIITATTDDESPSHDDEFYFISGTSVSRQYLDPRDEMPQGNNSPVNKYIINCSKTRDIVYTEEETEEETQESDYIDLDNIVRGTSLTLAAQSTKNSSKSYIKQCLKKSFDCLMESIDQHCSDTELCSEPEQHCSNVQLRSEAQHSLNAQPILKTLFSPKCQRCSNVTLCPNAQLSTKAQRCSNITLCRNVQHFSNAQLSLKAQHCSNATLCPNAQLSPRTQHCSNVTLCPIAQHFTNAQLSSKAQHYSNAQVYANAQHCPNDDIPHCSKALMHTQFSFEQRKAEDSKATTSSKSSINSLFCGKCNHRQLILNCDIDPQTGEIISSENVQRSVSCQWWIPLEKEKSRESAKLEPLLFEPPVWNEKSCRTPNQWWIPFKKQNKKNYEYQESQTNQAKPSKQANLSIQPYSAHKSKRISSSYPSSYQSNQASASNQANSSNQVNQASISCNKLSCECLKRSVVDLGNQANIIDSENSSLNSWESSIADTDTDQENHSNGTSIAGYETRDEIEEQNKSTKKRKYKHKRVKVITKAKLDAWLNS